MAKDRKSAGWHRGIPVYYDRLQDDRTCQVEMDNNEEFRRVYRGKPQIQGLTSSIASAIIINPRSDWNSIMKGFDIYMDRNINAEWKIEEE